MHVYVWCMYVSVSVSVCVYILLKYNFLNNKNCFVFDKQKVWRASKTGEKTFLWASLRDIKIDKQTNGQSNA